MTDSINKRLTHFQSYAESLSMTPEEYALSLHEKNQAIKSVFLKSESKFELFVREFHNLLDNLTHYKETEAKKGSYEHSQLIKQVTELLSTTSQDPKLLAQLYQHFPDGIEGKIEALNKSIN
ncbi:MAG: hypothetical protein L0J48_01895 [Alkalibacterium sp.]|uniref:hypothetical protein n=1 Tax=Alkalibacterium gilvum TaxID=1130080 RepID=UPI000EC0D234|nr:hypothetical protein [Alkalibacterium sp.]MDN6398471.1 hypothetical protein [Alkalibacterium sp.]HAJ70212.1 hypothetical protein [Alkalibacterium sp.]